MATHPTWGVVFDDKKVYNHSVKTDGHATCYKILGDDAFWSQARFSNLWSIQFGNAVVEDQVEYRDETPHSAFDAATHGDFNEFITRWDVAHLAEIQKVWDEDNNFTDTDPPVQETAEQKINRLGARPTSFTSPSV
jgi:hypothetical protein